MAAIRDRSVGLLSRLCPRILKETLEPVTALEVDVLFRALRAETLVPLVIVPLLRRSKYQPGREWKVACCRQTIP